uniref:Uncharacterized protein n=1 Tax=Panagrolaimus superbus TaxID=310955 RepID=A0A914YXN1_9BILA
MDKYQKKLLPKNEQLHKTALKFARKSSSYEVIKEVANNRNKLQNDRFAEMLIKTMKDCVDSAYIFASFRRQIRENANFEQILENQDIMKQSLNLLVRNMHLNPQRLPPAGIPTLDVAPQNNSFLRDERVITPPPAPAQRNAPRTQLQQLHRPTVPPNRAPINSNGNYLYFFLI